MELFGEYEVVVVGAGVTGVVASVAAARQGARTLLTEWSGLLGGLITGGRLTKPTGLVQPGVYRELIERAAGLGGADTAVKQTYWGAYTGAYDAEVMQRVIIELLEESRVDVLLSAPTTGVVMAGQRVRGTTVHTKSGTQFIAADVVIDTSGDGDAAALAGAEFMLGRPEDGLTQPMTSYFRILNVDFPELTRDCRKHAEDMWELVVPERAGERNEDYALEFLATGFSERIALARREGFDWIVPKDHITIKAGLLPGEASVNVTRFHGNALDPRIRSKAFMEIRKQAYCAFDFLKKYVGGFDNAILLDVAPVLGVRETRRILGDYVLTESDVKSEARFDDAVGLCNAPVDIHEPGGLGGVMLSVGQGYGIPYRCLLPRGIDGMLVAGRCVSADSVAFGSTRNTPACAITGQAAGVAAALAASAHRPPRDIPLASVQQALRNAGVVLGTSARETLAHISG